MGDEPYRKGEIERSNPGTLYIKIARALILAE